MSRTTLTHRRANPAFKWVAALPLAGLLVACSSFAQNTGEQRPVLDFRSCAKPMYPHDELAAHHEGTVEMKFLVGADGAIVNSRVEQTSGFPALDQAALDALNKCRFKPARKDGEAAQSWTDVKYVWTMK